MNLYIGSNGYVAAVDPQDGGVVWRTSLGGGLFSSPNQQDVCVLEHEDRVYAGCHGHLFALDAGSGQILWSNELKGMGYNDVTLTMAGKSVQFVSSRSHSHMST